MKNLVAFAISRTLECGACHQDRFYGPVPSVMEKFILEPEDVLYIPKDFQVLGQEMNHGATIQFTIVGLCDRFGAEKCFRLFPSLFFRSVMDSDGRRITAGGEVFDTLKWCRDYGEVMDRLRGRRIRVTCVSCYKVEDPRTGQSRIQRLYDFEWADK